MAEWLDLQGQLTGLAILIALQTRLRWQGHDNEAALNRLYLQRRVLYRAIDKLARNIQLQ